MKIIIVFGSKYGSSKQYAQWITDTLQCKIEDSKSLDINMLKSYDVIIYVGAIYAGQVRGFKRISKHLDILKDKKLLLCMVGMTNPKEQEKYKQIYLNNIPQQYQSIVKSFSLQGNLIFSKMSLIHRILMKAPQKMAEKIPEKQRTKEDELLLKNFGEDMYFASQESINKIVEYVKSLSK